MEHFLGVGELRGPDFGAHEAFWEGGAVLVVVGVAEDGGGGDGGGGPEVPGEVYVAGARGQGAVLAGDGVAALRDGVSGWLATAAVGICVLT